MIVVINQLHKYLLGELNVKWCKHITRPARDIFVFVNLQTFGSTLKGKYWLCFHQGRRQTWYLLQYPGLWHSWLHFLHRGWWFLVVWALAWALTMIMSSVFRLVVNISASCTGSRGLLGARVVLWSLLDLPKQRRLVGESVFALPAPWFLRSVGFDQRIVCNFHDKRWLVIPIIWQQASLKCLLDWIASFSRGLNRSLILCTRSSCL